MVLGGHKAVQAEGLTYEPEGEEHEQGAYVPVREAGLIGDGVVEVEESEEVLQGAGEADEVGAEAVEEYLAREETERQRQKVE